MSDELRKEFGINRWNVCMGDYMEWLEKELTYARREVTRLEMDVKNWKQIQKETKASWGEAVYQNQILRARVKALEEENARTDKAVSFIRNGVERLDCQDHSCYFAKDKSGMRTNGGCRCLPNTNIEHGIRLLLRNDNTERKVCRWRKVFEGVDCTSYATECGRKIAHNIKFSLDGKCSCGLPIEEVKE